MSQQLDVRIGMALCSLELSRNVNSELLKLMKTVTANRDCQQLDILSEALGK